MVGYDPHEEVHIPHFEHAVAGAISGASSRAICQPLDVVKIRFQLQVEPIQKGTNAKYNGLFQAFTRIAQEEGVAALWKGHVPAQFLSIVYGVAQYATFEILTEEIWQLLPESLTTTYRPLSHSVCGALSGCIATAFVHPVDVIRTRFVAQGEPKLYTSLTSAVQRMMREEGIRGYYRGLVPSVTLVGPQMGFQFGLYSLFTELWNRALGIWPSSPPSSLESLVCGSGSGLVAKLMVHPLDVIKKRLQVQGFEEARRSFGKFQHYRGSWHCLSVTLREEGIRSMYKGLTPSLLKAASVAGINFSVYEKVCLYLTRHHKPHKPS